MTSSVEMIKTMKLNDGYFLKGIEFKFNFDIDSVSDDQLCLFVQLSLDNKTTVDNYMLLIDDLSSLDDIYTLTNTGFCRLHEEDYVPDEHDPCIYTHIPFDYEDLSNKFMDHIRSGNLTNTFCGYFFSDEHLKYIDDYIERITESSESSRPTVIRLSDPRTRHYLVLEFGLFSGMDYSMKWTKSISKKYISSVFKSGDKDLNQDGLFDKRFNDQLFKGRGKNIEVTRDGDMISIGFPKSYDIKDEDFLWEDLKPGDLHNLKKVKEKVSTYQWDQIQDFLESGMGGRIIIQNYENDDLDKKLGRQSWLGKTSQTN